MGLPSASISECSSCSAGACSRWQASNDARYIRTCVNVCIFVLYIYIHTFALVKQKNCARAQ